MINWLLILGASMQESSLAVATLIIPVKDEPDSISKVVPIIFNECKSIDEVILIYDDVNDLGLKVIEQLSSVFPRLISVHNKVGGINGALITGARRAKNEILLVSVIDEVLPIFEYDRLVSLLKSNKDLQLVSATRYALGGKRYGGNPLGRIFSRVGNFLVRKLSGVPLSDSTTAIKAIYRKDFLSITLTESVGWGCILEMTLKMHWRGFKMQELPILSVDRPVGGTSKFALKSWTLAYLKWLFFILRAEKLAPLKREL